MQVEEPAQVEQQQEKERMLNPHDEDAGDEIDEDDLEEDLIN